VKEVDFRTTNPAKCQGYEIDIVKTIAYVKVMIYFYISLAQTCTYIIIIIIIIIIITYLLQLSFHSVAVVLTLVQTKQIGINIHKLNNTKAQYKQYKTQ
jgi:hypothetical protein